MKWGTKTATFPLALLSLMLLSVVIACGDPATPEAKLEADSLLRDAITARVDDGNVTLEGTVTHDAARKFALQIARSTPGVSTVRDHLDVESDEAS